MSKRRVSEIVVLLGLLLAAPLAWAGVWQQLSAAGPCDRYRPLGAAELREAEALFKEIFTAARLDERRLAAGWARLGYGLTEVPAAGGGWVGLVDVSGSCRGQGLYLVNRRPDGPLVLLAPHAYHDLYTGEIAGGLLRDDIALLAWNTAKRRLRGPGGVLADLAKRRDSLFDALTRALLETRPRGRLIQLHGFAAGKRRTAAGAGAAVIVSGGSRWPTPAVEEVAGCLRSHIDGPVLVYPHQVGELGATTNAQGQTLRSLGHEGFVHLELNRSTREALRASPAARAAFSDCLASGLPR